MFWLILGSTIPSMIGRAWRRLCRAALGSAVRDWSIGPGHGRSMPCRCPPAAGWPFGWASSLPLAVGQLAVGILSCGGLARHAGRPTAACAGLSLRPAPARPAAPIGQTLGLSGRRHGADAAGPGRRSLAAGLAAAPGRADRSWPWRMVSLGLADDAVPRRALAHRRTERALDRGTDQLVQHARQHGRAVGRRGGDCRGHVCRRDAADAPARQPISRSSSSPACCWCWSARWWAFSGTTGRRPGCSWATPAATWSATCWPWPR